MLWELRGDALNFRALQAACGDLSASVLSQRLGELREALLVDHDPAEGGYRLTAHGRALLAAFEPLQRWAVPWAADVAKSKPSRR